MKYRDLFDNWEDLREYRAGETVFSEGDPADAMYFIIDGQVEMQRRTETMSVEREGGIIGETALLESVPYNGTAVARSDARLARLNREQLKGLMEGNTDFALQVMAGLADRLRAVDAFIGARIPKGNGPDS